MPEETIETLSKGQRLARGLGFLAAVLAAAILWPMATIAVLALGAIIFVHELGHFTVCKLNGIRVEKFSIGFGPPLVSFERGGTLYQIAAVPLGGYVKPAGEFEEKPETEGKHAPDEFLGKPWYVRAAVLFAGPLFNFIFPAVFLFFLYATFGRPFFIAPPMVGEVVEKSAAEEAGIRKNDQILKLDGEWAYNIETLVKMVDQSSRLHPSKPAVLTILRQGKQIELKALPRLDQASGKYRLGVSINPGPAPLRKVVERVGAGTPAEKAGFNAGDEVLAVGGKILRLGTDFPELFAAAKEEKGKGVAVDVARQGKTMTLFAPKKQPVPEGWDLKEIGLIGLEFALDSALGAAGPRKLERMPVIAAAKAAAFETVVTTVAMVQGLVSLFTGKLGFRESVGGPVAIMRMAHQQAETGLMELLQFMMRISLILGVMNLLPIPLLDGGTLLLCFIEGIRRKPLPVKLQTVIQNIAAALLVSLMLFATYNDLANWLGTLTRK